MKNFEKAVKQFDEKVIYASTITKIDRHGYKPRKRVFVVTNLNVYLLDEKAGRVKDKIAVESISRLFVSSLADGFLIIAFSNDLKQEKVRQNPMGAYRPGCTEPHLIESLPIAGRGSYYRSG